MPVDADTAVRWADAERLANLLADSWVDTGPPGTRRPTVTRAWIADIEKMMRLDGRDADGIERAIRWAHADSFWSRNIASPRTLRRQYDRLRRDAVAARHRTEPRGFGGIREFLEGEMA